MPPQEREQKLQQFQKYFFDSYGKDCVEAIILHGSRASGFAREHSDWDFIILLNCAIEQTSFRNTIADEEIEYTVHMLPIEEKNLLKIFNIKLRHARVIYDKNEKGKYVLNLAQKVYKSGIPQDWNSPERRQSHYSHYRSAIRGMRDNIDTPYMFFKKFAVFYPRIINAWYVFYDESFPENLYFALPCIQKRDSYFLQLIHTLSAFESSPELRVQSAEKMLEHIFSDIPHTTQ